MFVTFPEDARRNAERQAAEFGVEVGEYRGVVRVPRRVFQRLLPERPTPERCVEAYYPANPVREHRRAKAAPATSDRGRALWRSAGGICVRWQDRVVRVIHIRLLSTTLSCRSLRLAYLADNLCLHPRNTYSVGPDIYQWCAPLHLTIDLDYREINGLVACDFNHLTGKP